MLLTPQVYANPALTETKEPAGGVALPRPLLPQQATEPSLLTPQVCSFPALTETKEPAGGVAWPSSSEPQQTTEPSLLTPQECPCAALTETKGFAGRGVGVGVSVGRGVFVGPGAEVGNGVFVGRGVAVGIGAGIEVEVVKAAATFASTVASIAVSASRVPRIPASTVAGTSAVGRDAACVSSVEGAALEQATAVRPEITKTIRMIILIPFPQFHENFQSSLSTG